MSIFFRDRRGGGAWLNARLWLFAIGAVLAMIGMALENDWVVGAAIAVLAVGFLLRFLPPPGEADRDVDPGPPGAGSGDDP